MLCRQRNIEGLRNRGVRGEIQDSKEAVWTVSIMLENLELLSHHNNAARIFDKVGLMPYFSLPLWRIDVKRSYQLINTLTEEDIANIEDNEGTVVHVHITKALVSEALKLLRENQSLLTRNTAKETNTTFLLLGAHYCTFKDL